MVSLQELRHKYRSLAETTLVEAEGRYGASQRARSNRDQVAAGHHEYRMWVALFHHTWAVEIVDHLNGPNAWTDRGFESLKVTANGVDMDKLSVDYVNGIVIYERPAVS